MAASGGPIAITVEAVSFALRAPFQISGNTFHATNCIEVRLSRRGLHGRGEAAGVYYRGEAQASMRAQIEEVRALIERGIDRMQLQSLLPAGGARNAVDCALWALEAAEQGVRVADLAGLPKPVPLLTVQTIGANTPEAMAAAAVGFASARALKLKLLGDEHDLDRVRQVRAARPEVQLAVDANQGFTRKSLAQAMSVFRAAGVCLIEQPFPIGEEAWMDDVSHTIPFAADESVQTAADVVACIGRFEVINIKLDKSGGLTEALAMLTAIRAAGLKAMVGNMTGSSLAMAPAFLIGQSCAHVDLDGPTFLAQDRTPSVIYRDGFVDCPDAVWALPADAPLLAQKEIRA